MSLKILHMQLDSPILFSTNSNAFHPPALSFHSTWQKCVLFFLIFFYFSVQHLIRIKLSSCHFSWKIILMPPFLLHSTITLEAYCLEQQHFCQISSFLWKQNTLQHLALAQGNTTESTNHISLHEPQSSTDYTHKKSIILNILTNV